MSSELIERLKKRTKRVLPQDWQDGLKCPECGTGASRPKCMFDMGGSCPRHDPDNYEPSPYQNIPDKDCIEAATTIAQLQAELAEAREVPGRIVDWLRERHTKHMVQAGWVKVGDEWVVARKVDVETHNEFVTKANEASTIRAAIEARDWSKP